MHRRGDCKRAAGAPVYEAGQVGRYRRARRQHERGSLAERRVEVCDSSAMRSGEHVQQPGDASVCIEHCRFVSRAPNPQAIEPEAESRRQPLQTFSQYRLVHRRREQRCSGVLAARGAAVRRRGDRIQQHRGVELARGFIRERAREQLDEPCVA